MSDLTGGKTLFTEFFSSEPWYTVMAGVEACSYQDPQAKAGIPVTLKPATVEILFCMEGSLVLRRETGVDVRVSPREILLISDTGHLLRAEAEGPFKGLLLTVETARAGDSMKQLCRVFGDLPLSMGQVGEIMASGGGFRVIPVSPWSRAVFYTLKTIPQPDWGQYGVIKSFELLYLMCKQNAGSENNLSSSGANGYLAGIAANMKAYMEEHLDEKLTILDLSRRFHLSRTACKSCFRACYGQPIHSWILDRRMEQATDLLEHTNMPVLQIAQAVGYSGVSQFNAAFKQRYGKTPREYRKMSISGCF